LSSQKTKISRTSTSSSTHDPRKERMIPKRMIPNFLPLRKVAIVPKNVIKSRLAFHINNPKPTISILLASCFNSPLTLLQLQTHHVNALLLQFSDTYVTIQILIANMYF
jgi:hypothetical protein